MAHIFVSFLAICATVFTDSLPINNGFSVRFNPLAINEDVKLKSFGALFAKIPQDSYVKTGTIGIQKSYYPRTPELFGAGCTNQVAKIGPISALNEVDDAREDDSKRVINLPLVKQPFENYKILVATAPENLRIDGEDDNNPLVVYIVFSGNESKKSTIKNIPSIYFVNRHRGKVDVSKKEKGEPILIIDSNRTITGLKSNEIHKFVKFKNKFNRFLQLVPPIKTVVD